MCAPSSNFCISANVKLTETQDGAVALDVNGGLYFGMNLVGVFIWNCLKEGCSQDELARRIADQFQIPVQVAFADAGTFLEQLKANGLLASPSLDGRGGVRRHWIPKFLRRSQPAE